MSIAIAIVVINKNETNDNLQDYNKWYRGIDDEHLVFTEGGGILWLVIDLILFVDEYGIDYLFDFDDGNISIGLWVGLALFIAMTL